LQCLIIFDEALEVMYASYISHTRFVKWYIFW